MIWNCGDYKIYSYESNQSTYIGIWFPVCLMPLRALGSDALYYTVPDRAAEKVWLAVWLSYRMVTWVLVCVGWVACTHAQPLDAEWGLDAN